VEAQAAANEQPKSHAKYPGRAEQLTQSDTSRSPASIPREAFGVRGACSRFFEAVEPLESAGKPDALQTLRDIVDQIVNIASVPTRSSSMHVQEPAILQFEDFLHPPSQVRRVCDQDQRHLFFAVQLGQQVS
jgi:hypothetical protein